MRKKFLTGLIVCMVLLAAWIAAQRADAHSTDTAVDFVKAVQAGNIVKAKKFLDDEKRRSIPRGGDDVYFQSDSGHSPNLGFLVGADFRTGSPVITQTLKDSFCLVPLDCGEGQMVDVPLYFDTPPKPKTVTLSLYLTREGPLHPWRIHHFSLTPASVPGSLRVD